MENKEYKLFSLPWQYFAIFAAVILLAAYTGVLPTQIDTLADGTAVYNFALLGNLDLVKSINSFFAPGGAFLDFYIAARITGSILGMNRKLLVKAAARYFPAIFGGLILAFACCTLLGAVTGFGAVKALLLIALPIMGGGMGAGSAVSQSLTIRREYLTLPPERQKERAVWDVLLQAAPKKEGDNDLSYIPVTEKVLAMKNGDLMIEYNLLPAIAVQAWERLHEK